MFSPVKTIADLSTDHYILPIWDWVIQVIDQELIDWRNAIIEKITCCLISAVYKNIDRFLCPIEF